MEAHLTRCQGGLRSGHQHSHPVVPAHLQLVPTRRAPGPRATPANAPVLSASKAPSSLGQTPSSQGQDLASFIQYDAAARSANGGTRRYDASDSMPLACDMLLVTSWEETSGDERQSLDEADCISDFMPGGGVSPSAISQGFATSKGPMKATMQDYFVAVSDALGALWSLSPLEWRAARAPAFAHHAGAPFCLTAVFDGHGSGDHAARTAQESVLAAVASDMELLDCFAHNMEVPGVGPEALAALSTAFRRSFAELDARICSEGEARGLPHDGTTALVSVQVGPKLYTANAGDCRAVLCRDGRALRLSRDHKPELPEERQRIEEAGGRVANVRGTWRVVLPLADGCTAKVCSVSRGFGDRDFKANALISPEPDVAALVLAPQRDTFAVHASDGLWGAVGDQEAVDMVSEVIDKFTGMTSFNTQHAAAAKAAAQELVKLARDRGSMDDITVVVTLYDWD